MDQLGRRETELEGTEQEMKLLRRKKNLEEELEVVKFSPHLLGPQ